MSEKEPTGPLLSFDYDTVKETAAELEELRGVVWQQAMEVGRDLTDPLWDIHERIGKAVERLGRL